MLKWDKFCRSAVNPMNRDSLRFKLLIIAFLLILAAGGERFISAILSFAFLGKMVSFLPYYLILSGFLWIAVAITALLGLWFNWQNKQQQIAIAATLVIVVTFWAERLMLYPGGVAQVNTLFLAIVSAVGVLFVSATVFLPL
jgi:hypothetical protein